MFDAGSPVKARTRPDSASQNVDEDASRFSLRRGRTSWSGKDLFPPRVELCEVGPGEMFVRPDSRRFGRCFPMRLVHLMSVICLELAITTCPVSLCPPTDAFRGPTRVVRSHASSSPRRSNVGPAPLSTPASESQVLLFAFGPGLSRFCFAGAEPLRR